MLDKRLIEKVKILFICIKIRDIQPNICIEKDQQIQVPTFNLCRKQRSSNQNRIFSLRFEGIEVGFQLFYFF